MIKRLLSSVREFKKPAILTLFLMIGEAAIECFIPFVTAALVNNIKNGAKIEEVIVTGVILTVLAVISLCFGGAAGFTSAKASSGFARNLRSDVFAKIQSYSFANTDKFSSTSLITRLTTDTGYVQMAFMMVIRTAVRSPLMMIFSITMAFIMGGDLAYTFVIIVPVLLFGLLMISKYAMPRFRAVFKKYDKLNESVEENVRGMRVVKSFTREEYEKVKFNKANNEIRKDFTAAERIVALTSPLMQVCTYFNMVFVLTLGSGLILGGGLEGTLDVGHISAMITYGFQVLMSLMMFSFIYVMLTMSIESMRRIDEVLREQIDIVSPENAVKTVENGSVEFKNVSFKYSKHAKKDALSDINLKIESGMTVGILGGTGSSKTTLIQLIPRLYDATEGSVLVGGKDVREYDLEALRSSVAVVLQKNLLFAGTIRDNLKWGNDNATDEEIEAAAKLAQADEFVKSFPNGYDTWIEQGGTNVSGGQKQRLCIARALIKKPKILILDDSTSAVDTKTDAFIRQGFKSYIPDTTKIIIAQRVASVMESDLIIILDGGKIVATGKHDELLVSSDIYREIYEQQTTGGAENA